MQHLLGWNLILSLPAILVVAWLAGRLLGVSRGWAATVVAGLVGWLSALGLSPAIAQGDPSAPGFGRNLWVFAIVLTMSSAVWMELLAKPGALARAQTSLVSLPRPIRAVRRSGSGWAATPRSLESRSTMGSGRCWGWVDGRAMTRSSPARPPPAGFGWPWRSAGHVRHARPAHVDPGRPGSAGRHHRAVPPAPQAEIDVLLEAELGLPVGEVFSEFDPEPIAAASIGQAYRARLRTGERVIVKVQRPGIAESVERDLLVLTELARTVEARTSWGVEYRVTELAGEFAERLREELDFRQEARNAIEIADLADTDEVHVPVVHRDLSTARVLVMEWLDGVSVREGDRIDAMGLDRARLADALLRSTLKQMLVDGRYHADPHPGNVLVLQGGRLGLLDFGATVLILRVLVAVLRDGVS